MVDVTRSLFRQLYVNDEDKRKAFSMFVRVQSLDGTVLGTFRSEAMKVISKPSKKKQTRNIDLCIFSGTLISLFNRVRSQTVSTRYLTSDCAGTALRASSPAWQAWHIWALDDPRFDPCVNPRESPIAVKRREATDVQGATGEEDMMVLVRSADRGPSMTRAVWNRGSVRPYRSRAAHEHLTMSDDILGPGASCGGSAPPAAEPSGSVLRQGRPLRYGDAVVLQNAVTGLVSAPLVLRAVEGRSGALVDESEVGPRALRRGDAISQLHKMAFGLLERRGAYLGLGSADGSVEALWAHRGGTNGGG
ncbi:hypothetical protein HK101_006520, partial [Irineochytrium annulatum]